MLVVGPAGAGKTRMLTAAGNDLHDHGREVFGLAPTANAARNLERDTGIRSDTVAKLLHEWQRTDRPPLDEYRLGPGATVIVDEAGMLSTPDLHRVVTLAEANQWRLALIGDPRQLQGVGRGGLLDELCANGRVDQLERLHRFKHPWEAAASLLVRAGDPRAFDAYEAHGRIIAGTLEDHLARMADTWITNHQHGRPSALVASTNDHVDTINRAIQQARLDAGHLDPDVTTRIAGGEHAHVGDVVATRRNDRRLITTGGEPVRNRDTWTVTAIGDDGSLTVSHHGGHGDVTLPVDYTREHVRLGYAATEHGWESGNVTAGICLVSSATTRRGLYVAVTRGGEENVICVITDSDDIAEARDILDGIVAIDRADIPAVTQRRSLAQQLRDHEPAQPAPAGSTVRDPGLVPVAPSRRTQRPRRRRATSRGAGSATPTAARRHRRRRPHPRRRRCSDRTRPRRPRERRRPRRRRPSDTRPPRNAVSTRRRVEPVAASETNSTSPNAGWNVPTPTSNGPGSGPNRQSSSTARRRHTDAPPATTCDTATPPICSTPCTTPSTSSRQRVAALDTWQRWAKGHDVGTNDLRGAVDTLNTVDGSDRPFAEALVGSLQQWAIHNHVELTRGRETRTRHPTSGHRDRALTGLRPLRPRADARQPASAPAASSTATFVVQSYGATRAQNGHHRPLGKRPSDTPIAHAVHDATAAASSKLRIR